MIHKQGHQETLADSIHVPQPKPIINLPHNDLCHTLNQTKYSRNLPIKSHFAFIIAFTISGTTWIEKIDFVTQICRNIEGFNDYNWKFHNQQAIIVVEFVNHDSIQHAKSIFESNHPNISFSIIKDLWHVLSNYILVLHNKRTHSDDFDYPMTSLSSSSFFLSSSLSFHLWHILKQVIPDDIYKNLSYYGNIDTLRIEFSSPMLIILIASLRLHLHPNYISFQPSEMSTSRISIFS